MDSVMWAVSRGGFGVDLQREREAAKKLVAVPRIFLGAALKEIAAEAKKAGVARIAAAFLETVRDKGAKNRA